tara:strand:+ start:2001 stop:2165 length:165 start_codon:yes stop_codon:yes gene_type:complete
MYEVSYISAVGIRAASSGLMGMFCCLDFLEDGALEDGPERGRLDGFVVLFVVED